MREHDLDQYMTELRGSPKYDYDLLSGGEDDMLDGLMFDGEADEAAKAAEVAGPSRGEQEITGKNGEIGSLSEGSNETVGTANIEGLREYDLGNPEYDRVDGPGPDNPFDRLIMDLLQERQEDEAEANRFGVPSRWGKWI
jgi:hypothetical protein